MLDKMSMAVEYRKRNRQSMTMQEIKVEKILKANRFVFHSQKVFKNENRFFIVDFYLKQPYKVCLEIDGRQHLGARVNYDVNRTLFLEDDKKRKVVRFRNDEVDMENFESILLNELEKHKFHYMKRDDIPIWASGKRRKYWERERKKFELATY